MNYSNTEIGNYAGIVWMHLKENGATTIAKIEKATELSRNQILLAIGWLSREEKIFTPETKTRSILFDCIQ